MKPIRVLVAEEYSHLKLLENIYHLLKTHCDVTFYVNRTVLREWSSIFPSANHTSLIINKFHSSTYFIWLLFHARRFDYINISTGPEGEHFSEIINIVCFYICCVIYKKKIILTVRRVKPYIRLERGVFSYLRNMAIRKLKRFTFETRTVRDVFREYTNIQPCYLGVSYDRYTDIFNPELYEATHRLADDRIRIGLLGIVNPDRREYGVIIDILKRLTSEERAKMMFVTLGGCRGDRGREVINSLAAYIDIDYVDGILTAEEFNNRGSACDILISPLTRDYGTFNGSGSFGDAIYLRKKIIMPSYVDPRREFKEIGVYYETREDLLLIFRNIEDLSRSRIDPTYFDQFSTTRVFKALVDDLQLCK